MMIAAKQVILATVAAFVLVAVIAGIVLAVEAVAAKRIQDTDKFEAANVPSVAGKHFAAFVAHGARVVADLQKAFGSSATRLVAIVAFMTAASAAAAQENVWKPYVVSSPDATAAYWLAGVGLAWVALRALHFTGLIRSHKISKPAAQEQTKTVRRTSKQSVQKTPEQ